MRKLQRYDGYEIEQVDDGIYYYAEDADKRIADLLQCIGLFTTAKADMVMNPDDPMAMAQEVVDYVRMLEEAVRGAKEISGLIIDLKIRQWQWQRDSLDPVLGLMGKASYIEPPDVIDKTGLAAEAKASIALDKGDGETQVCEPEKGGWRAARGVLREDAMVEARVENTVKRAQLVKAIHDLKLDDSVIDRAASVIYGTTVLGLGKLSALELTELLARLS